MSRQVVSGAAIRWSLRLWTWLLQNHLLACRTAKVKIKCRLTASRAHAITGNQTRRGHRQPLPEYDGEITAGNVGMWIDDDFSGMWIDDEGTRATVDSRRKVTSTPLPTWSLVCSADSLRMNREFTDFFIAVRGQQQVKCHRSVLSVASPLFQSMISHEMLMLMSRQMPSSPFRNTCTRAAYHRTLIALWFSPSCASRTSTRFHRWQMSVHRGLLP